MNNEYYSPERRDIEKRKQEENEEEEGELVEEEEIEEESSENNYIVIDSCQYQKGETTIEEMHLLDLFNEMTSQYSIGYKIKIIYEKTMKKNNNNETISEK